MFVSVLFLECLLAVYFMALLGATWGSTVRPGLVGSCQRAAGKALHGCYESVFRFCNLTGGAAAPPRPPLPPPQTPPHFLGGRAAALPPRPPHLHIMRGSAPQTPLRKSEKLLERACSLSHTVFNYVFVWNLQENIYTDSFKIHFAGRHATGSLTLL